MPWVCATCGIEGDRPNADAGKHTNQCRRLGISVLNGQGQCCLCALNAGWEGFLEYGCAWCLRCEGIRAKPMRRHELNRMDAAWTNMPRRTAGGPKAMAFSNHAPKPVSPKQAGAKSIYVFDFDSTLFRTPVKPVWWPYHGFTNMMESLCEPYIPECPSLQDWFHPATVVAAKKAIEDPTTWSVLVTYRTSAFNQRIKALLHSVDIHFDEIIYRPLCPCCSRLGLTQTGEAGYGSLQMNHLPRTPEDRHRLVVAGWILNDCPLAQEIEFWVPPSQAESLSACLKSTHRVEIRVVEVIVAPAVGNVFEFTSYTPTLSGSNLEDASEGRKGMVVRANPPRPRRRAGMGAAAPTRRPVTYKEHLKSYDPWPADVYISQQASRCNKMYRSAHVTTRKVRGSTAGAASGLSGACATHLVRLNEDQDYRGEEPQSPMWEDYGIESEPDSPYDQDQDEDNTWQFASASSPTDAEEHKHSFVHHDSGNYNSGYYVSTPKVHDEEGGFDHEQHHVGTPIQGDVHADVGVHDKNTVYYHNKNEFDHNDMGETFSEGFSDLGGDADPLGREWVCVDDAMEVLSVASSRYSSRSSAWMHAHTQGRATTAECHDDDGGSDDEDDWSICDACYAAAPCSPQVYGYDRAQVHGDGEREVNIVGESDADQKGMSYGEGNSDNNNNNNVPIEGDANKAASIGASGGYLAAALSKTRIEGDAKCEDAAKKYAKWSNWPVKKTNGVLPHKESNAGTVQSVTGCTSSGMSKGEGDKRVPFNVLQAFHDWCLEQGDDVDDSGYVRDMRGRKVRGGKWR